MSQAYWIDSAATELRIFLRVLVETWNGFRRSGWMNLVILVTMASILAIFGSLTLIVLDSQMFLGSLGKKIELSVYLKPETKAQTSQQVIQEYEGVQAIRLISKEDAWKDMKLVDDMPDIPNPLPDTLRVQVKDQSFIPALKKSLEKLETVEAVQYPHTVLKKLQDITRFISIYGLAFTVFLGVLTGFVISNTIHLLIEARSREIEILRMMGVGNWYIRLPFLLQGVFYGAIGAVLAFLPLPTVQDTVNQAKSFFQFQETPYGLSFVFVLMLLIGVIVGGFGSYVSVRRFLRV